jgi:hypothetical protein
MSTLPDLVILPPNATAETARAARSLMTRMGKTPRIETWGGIEAVFAPIPETQRPDWFAAEERGTR